MVSLNPAAWLRILAPLAALLLILAVACSSDDDGAFAGDDVLVAASEGHFAAQGAIYRRPVDGPGPLVPVGGGLPTWLEGIVDTRCIATHGSTVAVADRQSKLYVSTNSGNTWSCRADNLPTPSGILIV